MGECVLCGSNGGFVSKGALVLEIAYSFGMFDLLHYGHINALKYAKNHSDYHVLGLVSDDAAANWMGSLVSNYTERRGVIEQLSCVDEVMGQSTFDPVDNLKALHRKYPDAHITLYHGDNWKVIPARDYLLSIGGDMILTGYYERITPEAILEKLNNKNSRVGSAPRSNLVSTKADTLSALKPLLTKSRIEDPFVVTVGDAYRNIDELARRIASRFDGGTIVVRSSCSAEDTFSCSNAGHFESVLNVPSSDSSTVKDAIMSVARSYGENLEQLEDEQILVQPQTFDVAYSGVVFTRDVNENRPYYLIDYDDSGSTDSVTSGQYGASIWIARDADISLLDSSWINLIDAVREIEALLAGMMLDIEFAIDVNNVVTIFQVRPLAATYRFHNAFDDDTFFAVKQKAKQSYLDLPDVAGCAVKLSDMAFWNPAEIIGINPHPLDYSLYRTIITSSAWNEGLVPLGYREVPEELMYRIGNKPYISLQHSFLSLIPSCLDDALAKKLTAFYQKRLEADWSAHDKIEFEIVCSCFDLLTKKEVESWCDSGFSVIEIQHIIAALHEITIEAVRGYRDWLRKDNLDVSRLNEVVLRTEWEFRTKTPTPESLLFLLERLLNELKRSGTPQFSRQARFAFISRSICRSMVETGIADSLTMDSFMTSLHTVAADFERDFRLFECGQLSGLDFMERYGHLRSGTYDITSPRYDQMNFELRESAVFESSPQTDAMSFEFGRTLLEQTASALGLDAEDIDDLSFFLKNSLESRELFKFEFTKALSLSIEIIAHIGEMNGISRKDMSYLEMEDLYASSYYAGGDFAAFLKAMIHQRRDRFLENSMLVLPDVVVGPESIDTVSFASARPNFITSSSVVADAVDLDGMDSDEVDLSGKIVLLSKADPGYDWIFTRGIVGLVTEYGGAASHMAIRCAEFNLPAAIGCGKRIFDRLKGARSLHVDCKNQVVEESL